MSAAASPPPTGAAPRRFALRLAFLVLSSTALIFLFAFGYNYYASRTQALENLRENMATLTDVVAQRLETAALGIQRVPLTLAEAHGERPYSEKRLLSLLESFVHSNTAVFGSTAAFAPYAFDPQQRHYAPYYKHKEGEMRFRRLGGEDYDYFNMDWYRLPRDQQASLWSEPYFDEGSGNILMVTYSAPIYRMIEGERTFIGVVTADISLDNMNSTMNSIHPLGSGYSFLVSKQGQIITHPRQELIMSTRLQDLVQSEGNSELKQTVSAILAGQQGFVALEHFLGEEAVWLYYVKLPTLQYSMLVVIPEKEIFAEVNSLSRYTLGIGAAGLLLLSLVIILIAERISRPLRSLSESAHEVARGNLEIDLPVVRTNDEVGYLTRSFGAMQKALKDYIDDLESTTAAKERIESELRIARTIQMSFLPRKFPPFPQRQEIDLYADMEPAHEVGGDFYDFFLLGDEQLFISVGDVSDKGIPAALFMAVTKSLMKGIADKRMEPTELLGRVNRELCQENDTLMFATVFCGILDLRSGKLIYSNAGHNPPLLLRSEGSPAWLELPPGLVLGVHPESVYLSMTIQLAAGDRLLLYTDGVTDALSPDDQLFSAARLYAQAADGKNESAQQTTERIFNQVQDHARGAAPADDITLLCLRYLGSEKAS